MRVSRCGLSTHRAHTYEGQRCRQKTPVPPQRLFHSFGDVVDRLAHGEGLRRFIDG
jgi:hypothetical protein